MNQDTGNSSAFAASGTSSTGIARKKVPSEASVGTLVRDGGEEFDVAAEAVLATADLALPEGWRDRVRAELVAQVERGGTLYTRREDGSYVARTKSGDRVISRSTRTDP